MILMQFVAEGGEKVKVESLDLRPDLGKVRIFVDHGPGGVSSFIVPAGVVIALGAAIVSQLPVEAPKITEHSVDAIQTFRDGKLTSVRFVPRDQPAADPAAKSRGEADGVLVGLQL